MDLKIELTKLYGLHVATLQLEHAVRKGNAASAGWQQFPPSIFVYTFFTFNSIYAYNWSQSVMQEKAIKWSSSQEHPPKEPDQFKKLIEFSMDCLGVDAPLMYARLLEQSLQRYGIADPLHELTQIVATNLDKGDKELMRQFPKLFRRLLEGKVELHDFKSTLMSVARFVYAVRNNIFHGTKTRIEMEDIAQQRRLLIYAAVLSSLNGMFFSAVELAVPKWTTVPVDFSEI